MVKVAVYLIAFYLVYSVFLSRDTSYIRNRIFIIMSFIIALLLPLIPFQTVKPLNIQFFGKFLSEVFITGTSNSNVNLNSAANSTGPLQLIYSIYLIGAIIFIIKLLTDLINLLFLILRRKSSGSRIIRFHGFNTAGFFSNGIYLYQLQTYA